MTKAHLSKQHRVGQVYIKVLLDYLKARHDINETIYQNAMNHFLIGKSFDTNTQHLFYEEVFTEEMIGNELMKLKPVREIQVPTNLAEPVEMDEM